MTWRVTDVEEERRRLVKAWAKRKYSVVQLAQMFGVSERVAHKTLRRFREGGWEALKERSRARHTQASTPPKVVAAIVDAKRRMSDWGPRKLRNVLMAEQPTVSWPATSTFGSILKKHGLVQPRRGRRQRATHGPPCVEATAPNVSWSMDYKGQFRLGDGSWCYPFTVTDNASRYILCCEALDGTELEATWRQLLRCFRNYGLPTSIRSDNGSPFGAASLTGLTTMKVRLLKLGIMPDLIVPGNPQQNGRHERMHRTLKLEATSPPSSTKAAQQRRFNDFVERFNTKRPHEALGGRTPAEAYRPSARELPRKPPRVEYDEGTLTRRVRQNGCIKWESEEIFLAGPRWRARCT
jgi:putative transposase